MFAVVVVVVVVVVVGFCFRNPIDYLYWYFLCSESGSDLLSSVCGSMIYLYCSFV